MIFDASVVLAAFFPDESQPQAQAIIREHVAGRIRLTAPNLLVYELTNSVWMAERRGRITPAQAEAILGAVAGLDIALEPVMWAQLLEMARLVGCSAYDAAYLGLARVKNEPLITGDARLYRAASQKLDWVSWIGDYSTN